MPKLPMPPLPEVLNPRPKRPGDPSNGQKPGSVPPKSEMKEEPLDGQARSAPFEPTQNQSSRPSPFRSIVPVIS